jgi:hypothetical protein
VLNGTEVLRFPPVMTRAHVEKAGYLGSFPHLLGCVCGLAGYDREIHVALAHFYVGHDWTGALRERSRAHAGGLLSALPARRGARTAPGRRAEIRRRLLLLSLRGDPRD